MENKCEETVRTHLTDEIPLVLEKGAVVTCNNVVSCALFPFSFKRARDANIIWRSSQ